MTARQKRRHAQQLRAHHQHQRWRKNVETKLLDRVAGHFDQINVTVFTAGERAAKVSQTFKVMPGQSYRITVGGGK